VPVHKRKSVIAYRGLVLRTDAERLLAERDARIAELERERAFPFQVLHAWRDSDIFQANQNNIRRGLFPLGRLDFPCVLTADIQFWRRRSRRENILFARRLSKFFQKYFP
jgi:hypothetical protein